MHPSAEKVAAAAKSKGLDIEIIEFGQSTHSAEEAADAIGCQVSQIVKSLIFVVDGRPILALVAGDNRLDERKLARLFSVGRKKIKRADANLVKTVTGFSIGGVPPFGHDSVIPAVMDADLLNHDVVWAAAGTPHVVFAITPTDLKTAASAEITTLKIS